MVTVNDAYQELLSLTRQFLNEDSENRKWIVSSPETYQYYRDFASKNQTAPKQAPPLLSVQPKTIPSPPTQVVKSKPKLTLAPTSAPKAEPTSIPAEVKPEPLKSDTLKEVEKSLLKLEPLPSATTHDLSDIKKIIQERFPAQTLLNNPPDDAIAKKISHSSEKEQSSLNIVILSFTQQPLETAFLNHLARALSVCLGTTRVVAADTIDKQKAWNKLAESTSIKLIMGVDYNMYTYPRLMEHHSCDKSAARHYFGPKPLVMLSDIQSYLTHSHLKKALWKAIKQHYDSN